MENYGVIYRDYLEPENAETRRWFQERFYEPDTIVSWNGQMWKIKKVETKYDFNPAGPAIHEFVVEGSYV